MRERQLQFGHSQKAVENVTLARRRCPWREASIRPQPKGRGELEQARKTYARYRRRASIRPQPKGRGELPHDVEESGLVARFNSATAKRPWRTGNKLIAQRPAGCSSFNSATAKRPWRTQCCRSPRQHGPQLQFGHSQKAVENSQSKQSDRHSSELQFGHSQKAVENLQPKCGPSGTSKSLQFGHSQKAVENPASRSTRSLLLGALQFGHSQKAVENLARQQRRQVRRSPLQFGHSQKAVENVTETGDRRRPVGRFNSATAKRPWRTNKKLQQPEALYEAFNSATAKRPWRTSSRNHGSQR